MGKKTVKWIIRNWNRFIKWAILVLNWVFKLLKWIWNFFIKLLKWIWNRFTKLIGWIIFPATIIALIATLTVACINFFNINSKILEETKKCLTAINNNTLSEITECFREIDELSKGVFDSNAITFLVSFVLVFLGSIWVSNEIRLKKRIKEADTAIKEAGKAIKQLEIERDTMSIYSQILSLRVLSMSYQTALEPEPKGVMPLCQKTHRKADEILRNIRQDKVFITQRGKKIFDEIFENMIADFGMDAINEEIPGYPTKIKFRKSIDETIGVLKELQEEILSLKEV